MANRPHHGRVAAAMLGIVVDRGWMGGGASVDLPRVLDELREDGGVLLGRAEAVRWAMGFIDLTGGLEAAVDRAEIERLLQRAYDELRVVLGTDN